MKSLVSQKMSLKLKQNNMKVRRFNEDIKELTNQDIIDDICLELDLIDGVREYKIFHPDEISQRQAKSMGFLSIIHITLSNLSKKETTQGSINYVIDIENIKIISEIFEVIYRLNDVGFDTYISYLACNSRQISITVNAK